MDRVGSATPSRRAFLLGIGGLAVSGPLLAGCSAFPEAQTGWLFGEYRAGCTDIDYDEAGLVPVVFPHCAAELSWWEWDPASWNRVWVYRCHVTRAGRRERVVLAFDGVLSAAEVFVNGRTIGRQVGGYLPFDLEITDALARDDNVVAVVVDSRWGINVPPDRPRPWRPRSIDFYQPGGIPRQVRIRRRPPVLIADVHAAPMGVLQSSSGTPRVEVSGQLDSRDTAGPVWVTAVLVDGVRVVAEATTQITVDSGGRSSFALTLQDLGEIRLWDIDAPNLYDVRVSVVASGRRVDETRTRIGFRDVRFELGGCYLNGRRLQLFGLNRHEWYPYVGAAMPDRVHRRDAEILKDELNCVLVRCSHYPQSEAFLDACDELGLLVWEEAPGWDYIGDADWRGHVLSNVERMVRRDRNHPSIIVWGTRLNETEDDVQLYSQTRAIAYRLDGTRATTGAVNSSIVGNGPVIPTEYRDPFVTTPLVQDVFAFNDYLVPRGHQLPSLREPRTDLPYLVSEAVGVLVGPPAFRRTDRVRVQARQALLHAAVHDKAMSDPRYCGLLGWSAFDYPSGHGNTSHGVKWPGVFDLFREPKLGAGFYRAQVDPARRVVIEPAFYWGVDTVPGTAEVWSNCERLAVFVDGRPVAPPEVDRKRFPHLRYPPFVVELPEVAGDLRIDGWIGGAVALSRSFSSDRTLDRLAVVADDAELTANGADATRVVAAVVDRYGNRRGFAGGTVSWFVTGQGVLVGDNPLNLDDNGGTGAVWLRTRPRYPGSITLTAIHSDLGTQSVTIIAR
ncbi:beta-galactosidase [Saccharopolyspora sp. K220]|uniref:glycoside hydrolase family 2 protein n=1 Tax=Saccharopolyspora soli TaxID=2926618 RepID=UPI001F57CC31|nr:glycoside hydrolase family 2 TIM barrel-domain containing protein [Saccharopolyspora soli]MCI2419391.1 beta-galactosidase [Saccharopolyspora soli]